jgi:hypothetical protein
VGINKLSGIEGLAAAVTLVSPGAWSAAVWALSLHIAVRQKTLTAGAIRQRHTALIDIAFVQQCQEDVMSNLSVVICGGLSEQIEGYAHLLPAIQELLVIVFGYLGRGLAFLLSTHCYRCAVLVTARYHEHLVALSPVVAGQYISRQVSAGDMSQMERAIGIWPGYSYKNVFAQQCPRQIIGLFYHMHLLKATSVPPISAKYSTS